MTFLQASDGGRRSWRKSSKPVIFILPDLSAPYFDTLEAELSQLDDPAKARLRSGVDWPERVIELRAFYDRIAGIHSQFGNWW